MSITAEKNREEISMSDSGSGRWTRRRFLEVVGRAGGAAAVYEAMVALGMLRVPDSAYAQPPQIPAGTGDGKTIVILGAGVAGLTAAYELQKRQSGYNIIILEAQHRAGGRSYTVRTGDKIIEKHGSETWEQTCQFDKEKHLYLNAGPGRLPYHHTTALNYCKELNVPVEVYVMSSRANFYQNDGWFRDKATPNRRILNDTRGWIAELLAKAVDKGSLNAELSPGERTQMIDLLLSFGPLSKEKKYVGSQRAGYTTEPGVTTPGDIEPPIQLVELLGSEFWLDRMYQPEDYEWQPTLFQPVGGMDMLWKGFLPHVGRLIQYQREVTSVRNEKDKVVIRHRAAGAASGEEQTITADWCISTIPVWLLQRLDNNFTKEFDDALLAVKRGLTCKVGWQANRRFWELDDQIYGGISYINHPITQMWYPSNDYLFAEKGVLTGAYNYTKNAEKMGNQPLKERLRVAAEGAKRLHGPEFARSVPIDLGLSIAWHHVPYQEGGWADWDKVPAVYYNTLLHPDGKVFVAGDQVSYLPGWQEGAMLSAHYVLTNIARAESRMLMKAAAPAKQAPSTQAFTQGSSRTRD
jgi:monoamine oxidase